MNILKRINRCDLFILIWALYYLQGVLYSPGIINRILQLIIIIWAFIECLNVLHTKLRSPILKSLLFLLSMYIIYGSWIILFGDNITLKGGRAPSDYIYLQNSLNSLLPIFLFYRYTKLNLLTHRRIITYTYIFVLVAVLSFYKLQNNSILMTGRDEITNNIGYLFVSLIPFVYFFYKRSITQYILLGFLLLFIFMSMKRGAILIGTLSTIIFLYTNFKNTNLKKKFVLILLTSFFLIIGVNYLKKMLETSDYFVSRIEDTMEGNTSNRDILYGRLIDAFNEETNILNILFGHGANATIGIAGNYAHQDWLETLTNNGIIGCLILFMFYAGIFTTAIKQRNKFQTSMFYSFITLFLIVFSKSIFSMSIQDMCIYETLLLGYFTYWSTHEYKLTTNNNIP